MTLVAVAVLAFVVVLVVSVRAFRDDHGASGPRVGPPVQPLLGARVRTAPDHWVVIRDGLGVAEANVVRGLLESNGIRAAVDASGPNAAHLGMPPSRVSVFTLAVAPRDAAVARQLLDG